MNSFCGPSVRGDVFHEDLRPSIEYLLDRNYYANALATFFKTQRNLPLPPCMISRYIWMYLLDLAHHDGEMTMDWLKMVEERPVHLKLFLDYHDHRINHVREMVQDLEALQEADPQEFSGSRENLEKRELIWNWLEILWDVWLDHRQLPNILTHRVSEDPGFDKRLLELMDEKYEGLGDNCVPKPFLDYGGFVLPHCDRSSETSSSITLGDFPEDLEGTPASEEGVAASQLE